MPTKKNLEHIFRQNERWAESLAQSDPGFFQQLSDLQRPEYLWIGCSDSRVPANQITGLLPGEVFVHRNVGNLVWSSDLNCLSVLQYAIEVLHVKHIIVCGHYGCGAVRAVLEDLRLGLIDYWLTSISLIRERHQEELRQLASPDAQLDKLCELNVIEQAKSVCRTDLVQDAWARGQQISVHGWIYRLDNGRLRDLGFTVSSLEEFRAAS